MEEVRYFPMFFDLSKKNILAVGGGRVAGRRVETLLSFSPQIQVISEEFTPKLLSLERNYPKNLLLHKKRIQCREDIDFSGFDLFFGCTSDAFLNASLAAAAKERGLLVNVCTDKSLCDFFFPSVLFQEGTVIGIGSSGENPAMTKRMREKLHRVFTQKENSGERKEVK